MSLVTVVLTSIRVAMVSELGRYGADHELQVDREDAGVPPDLVARLRALPELAVVVPEACTPDAVAAGDDLVCAVDPGRLAEVFDLEVVAGRMVDIGTGGIAVSAIQARTEGWTLGSPVTVRLSGGSATYPVVAIYRGFYYLGAPIMAPDQYARLGGDPTARTVYVRAADGIDPATARTAIQHVVGADPAVQVRTRAEVRAAALDQIDAATWVYRALTGLAILVGLFGIGSVLALSIVERGRELGLLRAIGLGRRQVRAMVRAEAAVVAVVGIGAGIGLGLLFGWATVRVLELGSQPIRFALPAGTLAAIAAVAVVAALIAAAVPASWASRLPMLRME
jgi:putative ABC transport system permease protein